jgi:hypothetical protein
MSKLVKLLEDVSGKREALRNQVKAVLADGIQDFMKEHPSVKALGWTQYTPYFNDGEECVFSVNGFHASTKDEDERSEDLYDEGWVEVYSYKSSKAEEGFGAQDWSDLIEFTKVLGDAEEDLRYAFGDHVRVIVTQNGIDVEEHEHD